MRFPRFITLHAHTSKHHTVGGAGSGWLGRGLEFVWPADDVRSVFPFRVPPARPTLGPILPLSPLHQSDSNPDSPMKMPSSMPKVT